MTLNSLQYPYHFENKVFNDEFEFDKYLTFFRRVGNFIPDFTTKKLVRADEWRNADGQSKKDLQILAKMETKTKKPKAKSTTNDGKAQLTNTLISHLDSAGYSALYQDTPVTLVDKVGIRVRTSANDYVVKITGKKDKVERTAVTLKDTKSTIFKNRLLREIQTGLNNALIVKGGVVVEIAGKDYIVSVVKKSTRV